MYLAQTYQEYIESTKQNVYSSKKVALPEAELYVIYIGDHMKKPEYICLSEEFFGGRKCAVEVKVKMTYNGEKGDIISQYVTFTRIYNEQIHKLGRTREAVLETIRICTEQDVLKEYLENRKKEVVDIMITLFDDDYIYRTYFESVIREAEETAAQKAAEKAAQEAQKVNERLAQKLYGRGTPVEDIADILEISAEEIRQWIGLMPV